MTFYTSLSGLRGAQTDLSTISNNIANVGATGFKRSRTQFGDIMPPSTTTAGLGTRLKSIDQQFTQGSFDTSTRQLDLAISGDGFFLTRDGLTGGSALFTRNGAMSVTADRYLVDSNGAYVQVLPVDANGSTTSTSLAAARNLQLPLTSGQPQATSLMNLTVAFPSNADKPADRSVYGTARPYAFDRTDPNSYNYAQQTTVYDSAGAAYPATLYFSRSQSVAAGDPGNAWEVHAYVGDEAATPSPITLTFDAAGTLTGPSGPQSLATVSPPGAASPMSIALDFGSATQASSGTFTVGAIDQDGLASAQFADMAIGRDGLITATFSDGTTQALGRVLIARFSNPGGLRQQGDARWTVTGDSGDALIGTPGSEGFGQIQTGALERANVDITEELVALISAQRNFQANAKAIDTANAMTQSIINLRN